VKEKLVETYKNLGERMPDDDLFQTFGDALRQGCTIRQSLEDATLTRLRPICEKEIPRE